MRRASIGNPPQSSGPRSPQISWLISAVQELARASQEDTAEQAVAAFQPKDGTLTALAGLAGLGFVVETAPDVFALRTLVQGGGITLTNPAGTAGDTTIEQTAGSIVDSAFASYSTNAAITAVIPADDTPPLIGEGTEILSITYTPKNVTNKLICIFVGEAALSALLNAVASMFQGSTILNAIYNSPSANGGTTLALVQQFTPGSTSPVAVSVRVGPGAAGTLRMNGTSAGRIFGGAAAAILLILEVKA